MYIVNIREQSKGAKFVESFWKEQLSFMYGSKDSVVYLMHRYSVILFERVNGMHGRNGFGTLVF